MHSEPSLLSQLRVFPTWYLVGLMGPFLPKGHPFKQTPSLADWTRGATYECRLASMVFWLYTVAPVGYLVAHVL